MESATAAPSESGAPVTSPTTIAELAAATGCGGFTDKSSDPSLPKVVAQYGECAFSGGGRGQLYAFASDADMTAFWDLVAEYGVTSDQAITVGHLVLAAGSRADLRDARGRLGASS